MIIIIYQILLKKTKVIFKYNLFVYFLKYNIIIYFIHHYEDIAC